MQHSIFYWFNKRFVRYGILGTLAGLAYAAFALGMEYRASVHYHDRLHIILAPVLFGMFALLVGWEQDKVRRQAQLLDDARQNFTDLTHAAITRRDWNVSFHDAHVPTCWEVKNCDKADCPSFGKEHIRCWLVAGTFCRGEVQGRFAQKLGNCAKCEVYQDAVEHDPISQIGENFNSLMWALREKEDMLAEANQELHGQYSELEDLQEKTSRMADTDILTGLWNHGHFQRHLKTELQNARRDHAPLSILMLDLDFFKTVNDRFGHQKGDAVLRNVGALLHEEFQDIGYAARYGGEEFIVVIPMASGAEALKIADSLRQKIKALAPVINIPPDFVGASIGVADFPDCASERDSLISAADSALLFAKRKGRNRVCYFRDLSETEVIDGDVDRLQSRLEGVGLQTINALAEAVDVNDQYLTASMPDTVGIVAAMAHKLGMSSDETDALALATRIHDIGKIGVPGSILRKKEKLSAEEMSIVQRHPEMGQQIIRETETIQDLITAILYHHERWDGKGYPEKLRGDEIPLMARIVGIMDAYRAMLTDRPYRKALTVPQALEELKRGAGSQFDPALVELFIELVRQEPKRALKAS